MSACRPNTRNIRLRISRKRSGSTLLDVESKLYARMRMLGKAVLVSRGDALKQLIDLVQSGTTDFTTILVYDVSRWGRFQDADESAYYEYICKRAGISVQYCAEQFENDGSRSPQLSKASSARWPANTAGSSQ